MNLSALKQKINIKYFMAVYLAVLLGYAAFANQNAILFVKGLLMVICYCCLDLLWTYLRDKKVYLPVSSVISGWVIAIVAIADPVWWMLIVFPLLAVASKQLLHFGKLRHIFNPAGFSMAIVGFFLPAISWWATSWNNTGMVVVLIFSAFILWRQNRWHVTIPFLISFTICLTGTLLLKGVPGNLLPTILNAEIFNGTILFFSTVMLIEPMTSTFPTTKQRIIYGVLVGVFANLITLLSAWLNFAHQDPLVLGLLLGNLTASILFLPSRPKIIS